MTTNSFRESLGLNLIDEGFAVVSFDSGAPALDYFARGGAADVILLDWRMPGMNGLEVLRRLRRAGSATPVIFLTVLSDDIYEEAALEGGAVDFIDKSRRLSILVKRLSSSPRACARCPRAARRAPPGEVDQSRPARAALRHQPRRLERPHARPDLDRVQDRRAAGAARRRGCRLSRDLRSRARQGFRRRLWRRGLPRQRAYLHQAHPQEIPRLSIASSIKSTTMPDSATAGLPAHSRQRVVAAAAAPARRPGRAITARWRPKRS